MKQKIIFFGVFIFLLVLAISFVSIKGFLKQGVVVRSPQKEVTFIPTPTPISQVIFTIEPKARAVRQEEIFSFDISIQSNEEIMAVDLFISFDPTVLKFQEIKPGGFFTSPMEFSRDINEENGKIFYALGSLSPTSGKGNLISLIFKSRVNAEWVQIALEDKTIVAVKGEKPVKIILPSR